MEDIINFLESEKLIADINNNEDVYLKIDYILANIQYFKDSSVYDEISKCCVDWYKKLYTIDDLVSKMENISEREW